MQTVLQTRPKPWPLIQTSLPSCTHNGAAADVLGVFSSLLVVVACLAATSPAQTAAAQAGSAQPVPVRHYTFDDVSADRPEAVDQTGKGSALIYQGQQPVEIVPGRTPDSHAVRIDAGAFRGEAFDVGNDGVTVLMWLRKLGQGSELGNGRTNGMLFAVGNGYWEGLRAYCENPDGNLLFQIGRPQPQSAVTLQVAGPVPDRVWQCVAVTWNRRQMRIYLNGVLLGATDYAGDYTPGEAPFRVGYANAGIGSLILEVDEVTVFDRALDAASLLAAAWDKPALSSGVAEALHRASGAAASGDWQTALAAYREMANAAAEPLVAALARLGMAQALEGLNRSGEATSIYTQVAQTQDVPEVLQMFAARRCVSGERGVLAAGAPLSLLEELSEQGDLSESERVEIWKATAEAALRAGRAELARQLFGRLTELVSDPHDRWNFRLQAAHAYLAAGEYDNARQAYRALSEAADAPEAIRGLSLLAVAHTFYREEDYRSASDAYAAVTGRDDIPDHHRQEAEQLADEMDRLARGLPRRDGSEGKTEIAPLPQPGLTLHVAPDGDDDAPGTAGAPLASLAGARDRIRRLRAEANGLPAGGVTVTVHSGAYRMHQTWELTQEDSGTADAPIVYRAANEQQPIFTGGVQLREFSRVTDPEILRRLPDDAREHVYQCDLKQHGIDDLGQITVRGYGHASYPVSPWVDLYVNRRGMQLARWPNDDFVEMGKVHQGAFRSDEAGKPGIFEYTGDRPNRWQQADEVWMFGYWGHLWAGSMVRVAEFDRANKRIIAEQGVGYGFREGYPYYYFNLLEEIDQPGEWYLDRESGLLYIYPPEDARGALVQLPVLSQPLVEMQDVSHVRLEHLTFELGRTDGVVVEGGSHVLLAGCTLRQFGGNGVVVRGGQHHGVFGCDIFTVGAGGARIAGGDAKTLTPGNHFLENTHVFNFTRVDRVYAPAIHLDGVGNRIAHNLFHESPHHAMRVEGYDQTIEFNEVHSVVYESDDQSGIDIYGNAGYRGNVIRYNFWHHIGSGRDVAGQAGIRLDDFISATLMYGNVFYRAADGRFGAIQIHGGKDNIADNNLFVDCQAAFSFSPWGETRWKERLKERGGPSGTVWAGVDVSTPPHLTRWPDLARLEENADRNFLWRNVAVRCGVFALRERGVNVLFDNIAYSEDPGFASPASRNFTLPDDSPVYDRLGFRPIPFSEIGLYPSPLRASWPVEHTIAPQVRRD